MTKKEQKAKEFLEVFEEVIGPEEEVLAQSSVQSVYISEQPIDKHKWNITKTTNSRKKRRARWYRKQIKWIKGQMED